MRLARHQDFPPARRLSHHSAHRIARTILAVSFTAALAGCVTNEELGNPEGWQAIRPAAVPELQALLPVDIARRGTLIAGANTPYAPNEFKNSQGDIIGYEVDLIKALGSLLGLNVTVRQMDFNLILPAISAGTLDVGSSAFTDTPERQKNYDFVDFFNTGIAWATQLDNKGSIDPDNACGLTVAVQKGTYSETDEVQNKSEACIAQGKQPINKLVYATADAAATATILKRADAYASDSPVISYAIARSNNSLVQVGETFDTAPFGFAVSHGSSLGPALGAALVHLKNTGDYQRILRMWGLEKGSIDTVTFNLLPFNNPVRQTIDAPALQPSS